MSIYFGHVFLLDKVFIVFDQGIGNQGNTCSWQDFFFTIMQRMLPLFENYFMDDQETLTFQDMCLLYE